MFMDTRGPLNLKNVSGNAHPERGRETEIAALYLQVYSQSRCLINVTASLSTTH